MRCGNEVDRTGSDFSLTSCFRTSGIEFQDLVAGSYSTLVSRWIMFSPQFNFQFSLTNLQFRWRCPGTTQTPADLSLPYYTYSLSYITGPP